MKKKILISIMALMSSVTFTKNLTLNIIHISDNLTHLESTYVNRNLKIGGYPEIVNLIQQLKYNTPNSIVFHAGNSITGAAYSYLYPVLIANSSIDYLNLGVHEFDGGDSVLNRYVRSLPLPVISTNAIPSSNSILSGAWKPYAIKEIDGEKVGILGVVPPKEVQEISSPGNDIKFTDEIETLQKYVDYLESKGVNKIIVMSSAGFDRSKEIARKVKGIDIIISSGDHDLYGDDSLTKFDFPVKHGYPVIVVDKKTKLPTLIVGSWCYSRLVGDLNVTFDSKGVLKSMIPRPLIPYYGRTVRNTYMTKANPSKIIQDLMKKYGDNEEVKDMSPSELASIMLKSNKNLDLVIQNSQKPNDDTTLVIFKLRGVQVKQVLLDAISSSTTPYVAGIRFDKSLNNVEVLGKDGKWYKIIDGKEYMVGTNSDIAKGKFGYIEFGNNEYVDTYIPLKELERANK